MNCLKCFKKRDNEAEPGGSGGPKKKKKSVGQMKKDSEYGEGGGGTLNESKQKQDALAVALSTIKSLKEERAIDKETIKSLEEKLEEMLEEKLEEMLAEMLEEKNAIKDATIKSLKEERAIDKETIKSLEEKLLEWRTAYKDVKVEAAKAKRELKMSGHKEHSSLQPTTEKVTPRLTPRTSPAGTIPNVPSLLAAIQMVDSKPKETLEEEQPYDANLRTNVVIPQESTHDTVPSTLLHRHTQENAQNPPAPAANLEAEDQHQKEDAADEDADVESG